ncbi:hypothetical protein BN59_03640 [Legionella massiliensis]|uniref:Uncharacterized protein n=1 Tax=Legionella massiliensis TaxID=1034943 RepID=A0A078L269_9GAMM|nr:hypothetical protein BN59_03640 [Legionella massiliensis]CEE15060.1 hypothetical protein BN1094_03640 [Legionella massiliensis]
MLTKTETRAISVRFLGQEGVGVRTLVQRLA